MTKIEWTEKTWNPIVGCSVVSPGCTNCYAMAMARRLGANPTTPHYAGTTKTVNGKPVWTGKVALAPERTLLAPLRWRKPTTILVNSMSDPFHKDVPDEWIDRVFAVMVLCPQHTFQLPTKRSARMRKYLGHGGTCIPIGIRQQAETLVGKDPGPLPIALPNVWLGVSIEDQTRADERIPDLLATPAAVRFVSCEPLLGPIDLRWVAQPDEKRDGVIDALIGRDWIFGDEHHLPFTPARSGHEDQDITRWFVGDCNRIDWVIVGGESGPNARPMHPDWVRSLRDQCQDANVPFFFKQWGEWALSEAWPKRRDWMIVYRDGDVDIPDYRTPDETIGEEAMVKIGKKRAGRMLDGRIWDEIPGRPV